MLGWAYSSLLLNHLPLRCPPPAMKLASFEAIVRALNDAGVRYLVVGGLAVNAHGFGRVTYDVDVENRLELGNVRAAFAALRGGGLPPGGAHRRRAVR